MNSYFSKSTALNGIFGALLLASGPLFSAQVTETITLTTAPQKQQTQSFRSKAKNVVVLATKCVVGVIGAATLFNSTARLVSNNLPPAKYARVRQYCRNINFRYDDIETFLTQRRLNK